MWVTIILFSVLGVYQLVMMAFLASDLAKCPEAFRGHPGREVLRIILLPVVALVVMPIYFVVYWLSYFLSLIDCFVVEAAQGGYAHATRTKESED
jgi:hypothetical protein